MSNEEEKDIKTENISENAAPVEEKKDGFVKNDVPKSSQITPKGGVHVDQAEKEAFLESIRKRKLRNKIITTVIVVLAVFIIAFVIYKIAFGDNKSLIKFSDDYLTKTAAVPLAEGKEKDKAKDVTFFATQVGTYDLQTVKMADGSRFVLSYNYEHDLLTVKEFAPNEKKTPRVTFRSYPEPLEEEAAADSGIIKIYADAVKQQIISSLIRVGYTKSGMDGGIEMGINQIPHEKVLMQLPNNTGMQIKYTLTELECSFVVMFQLNEKGQLIVTIPAKSIIEKKAGPGEKEDEMPRIASITVLPYMCASRQGESGCYVTPDGSGAVTYFDRARISNFDEYSKRVYGYDYTFDSFDTPDYNNETLTLPVFGFIKNEMNKDNTQVVNKMITAIATEGEAATSVIMGNPGMKNLNFYYIAYKYNFREFYYSSLVQGGDSYKFLEVVRGIGDIQTTYTFSNKSVDYKEGDKLDANAYTYVDIAKNTREYLLTKWGNNKKVDTSKDADLMNIKVFMGAENMSSTSLFAQVKVMTSFKDVKSLYSDMKDSGVKNIRLSLLGWANDGYYGNITKKYSIESDYGGKKGLKELISWAKENDVTLSADNNLTLLYGSPAFGTSLRSSVVKNPGTQYLKFRIPNSAGVYRLGTDFYYMSPIYFNDHLLEKDIKKLSGFGFDAVDLQQVGSLVYTDYNKKNALLRQQEIKMYEEWIKAYKEKFGQVSVYYGNEYAVKNADLILDIPTESSSLFLLDESVPFIQIVYHGLIDYYCEPINRADNPATAVLKSFEYGCLPSFEITKENTEELKYTYYCDLFKSEYGLLKSDIQKYYALAEKYLSGIRSYTISNHYSVDGENVYCTEYTDGSKTVKIFVNYADKDFTLPDGQNVPSKNILYVG